MEVKADGITETMYMYKNEVDNLCKSPDKLPTMARLLPYEDAIIKVINIIIIKEQNNF